MVDMSSHKISESIRKRSLFKSPNRPAAEPAKTSDAQPSSSSSTSRTKTQPAGISQTQILPTRSSKFGSRPTPTSAQDEDVRAASASRRPRSSSLEFPERLKSGDDVGEDVTKLGKDQVDMNSSFLNLITAAGSSTEFHSRLDDITSDSDIENKEPRISQAGPSREKDQGLSASLFLPSKPPVASSAKSTSKHLLRSLHRLKLSGSRGRKTEQVAEDDTMSSSQILVPQKNSDQGQHHDQEQASPSGSDSEDEQSITNNQDAPYLSMILKGEAEMKAQDHQESPTESSAVQSELVAHDVGSGHKPPTLASRIMEIFKLPESEEVIAEYPAWFLQTVLLSGHLYVTPKHICFYAYMPKSTKQVSKSGYLGKRGQRNPRYKRYYVELKGDVLRYYDDPTKPYMPKGQIDLRSSVSATVHADKNQSKEESSYIRLVTTKKQYQFRADSAQSAKDWIKQLQKIIFRTHNDGDGVKILLPIQNVIDFEVNQFFEISDTIKLRVIDNEETYSVDEYYFSFFGAERDAIRVIKAVLHDNVQHDEPDVKSQKRIDSLASAQVQTPGEASQPTSRRGTLSEPVRTTLLPTAEASQSRTSSFESRRSSADVERLEAQLQSRGRDHESHFVALPTRAATDGSNASDWNDQVTESSAAGIQSMADSNLSSSQILNRSDVFRSPTNHAMPRSRSRSEESRSKRRSQSSKETGTQLQPVATKVGAGPAKEPTAPTTPTTLNNLMRAGAYPVGRASDIANMIKDQSRKLGLQVTSQSMDYLEKIAGMWQAPTRHYRPVEGMPSDDDDPYGTGNLDAEYHSQRFRDHFALPDSERLIATYFGSFWRVLPLYGKIYISQNFFCYRSLLPGTRTKLMLPLRDIESVSKKRASYRPGYPGLVLTIRGHEEIFFDFSKIDPRDDCTVMLILVKEAQKSEPQESPSDDANAEYENLQQVNADATDGHELLRAGTSEGAQTIPMLFDDLRASVLNFKPAQRLNITCLTIGSRGDIQPYIALDKALILDGHHVKIATHTEFEPWIRKHGIDFSPVSGDPGELMRICIQHGMFTYNFLREASSHFRVWIDELLITAWEACKGTDLLIESPSAMAGIHIAEKLQIPYFRAFTMPWTRTRAYPHAFAVPSYKQGGGYNYLSYVLIDGLFWKGTSSNVNRWRTKTLGLLPTSLNEMQQNKVPFLYAFSPQVVAPPLDFSDWIRITGYWFLDEGDVYEPPEELVAFIKKAKDDDKKLVYIGFGSILVDDPVAMTNTVIDAVQKADVRCILAKGWSERQAKPDLHKSEPTIPDDIFVVKSIPHDWLFPQCDAVAHHGGCGTTGASLRAGVPVIAKPFFGDQYFFGQRVEDLGVGIHLRKLNSTMFGRALWEATRSERMKAKARAIGDDIRKEDGVATAITALYRDLEYARSLIRKQGNASSAGSGGGAQGSGDVEDIEEHWTFVEAAPAFASPGTEEVDQEALVEEAMRLSKQK